MKIGSKANLAAIMAMLALFGGCLTVHYVGVQDSTGARVFVRQPVNRIVSTVPSNTEILYALGLQDRVVGVTEFCGKTCNTNSKTSVGGWTAPDCDKIRALKPDLIFAFGGAQSRSIDRFREIAPTYCFEPATVDDTFRVILDIGRLTQRLPEAREIVKAQRAVLDRVQTGLAGRPAGEGLRVARVFGTNTPVLTAGGKSFLTDVIRLAGGTNVFGDLADDYPQVPFERLAALDPDVLIVHGETNEAAARQAAFRASADFSKLRAVKTDRVLVYSCADICHPNAAIADTVAMVAKGLYPDLFNNVIGH